MRVYALYLVVAGLSIYAWKDWFKSLCGLILLMAVIEHEDMPKSIMGIQGLNPWNILMFFILLAWAASRRREGLVWDMPRPVTVLLLLYLGVILVGFARMMADRSHIEDMSVTSLVSEELINTVKWTIPGLLLFDGCRSKQQLTLAVCCLLGLYLLVALQVARQLPIDCAMGGMQGVQLLRLKLVKGVGYSSCDMSTMLAGASWAMLAMVAVCRTKWQKVLVVCAAALTAYSQALTGGRAGYAAWGVTGLVMGLVKAEWRKYLLLAPVVPITLYMLFPGAAERALQGVGEINVAGEAYVNNDEVSSGRASVWPYVVDKIGESPGVGYGCLAMRRTGLTDFLEAQIGMGFFHPHNAYLEWLLDNGVVGLVPVAAFFGICLVWSAVLFRNTNSPWYAAVGGIALSLVLAQLLGAMGSQHFYPRVSTTGMWASALLAIRLWTVTLCAKDCRAASLASVRQGVVSYPWNI